jgi:hypothetical protein
MVFKLNFHNQSFKFILIIFKILNLILFPFIFNIKIFNRIFKIIILKLNYLKFLIDFLKIIMIHLWIINILLILLILIHLNMILYFFDFSIKNIIQRINKIMSFNFLVKIWNRNFKFAQNLNISILSQLILFHYLILNLLNLISILSILILRVYLLTHFKFKFK